MRDINAAVWGDMLKYNPRLPMSKHLLMDFLEQNVDLAISHQDNTLTLVSRSGNHAQFHHHILGPRLPATVAISSSVNPDEVGMNRMLTGQLTDRLTACKRLQGNPKIVGWRVSPSFLDH